MSDDKSHLQVSASDRSTLKNFVLNVSGPGPVIVIVAWLISVVLLTLYATGAFAGAGLVVLAIFMQDYVRWLARQPRKDD
jgi:hypothetical protein